MIDSAINGVLQSLDPYSAYMSPEIFKERFQTIERVFAWEDKFKRLIVRFEHLSQVHYAMKMLAFSLINLRYFTVRE